jgi:hypothetical protein
MVKGIRACPICPSCGGKKFRIIEREGEVDDNDNDEDNNSGGVTSSSNDSGSAGKVTVECLECARRITV